MALVELALPIREAKLPGDVRTFLRDAVRRVQQFQHTHLVPGFVPSDFARTYSVLETLVAADIAPGQLFCEWGSGFGVVSCLAAMLDFEACGIEIEADLVEAAQQLADAYGLPVDFCLGSFIPPGGAALIDRGDCHSWLTVEESRIEDELGLTTDAFDVIFAYPWPDEEEFVAALFDHFAAAGAILVTFHGGETFLVRRKVPRRSRRRNRTTADRLPF